MRTKRIEQVEEYIIQHKTVTIDTLCEVFDVSKNTIRRDLDELAVRGTIKKIYGGVTANASKELLSFDERNITNMSAKLRIARRASEFVRDGDIVFIDSGTTPLGLVDCIKDRKGLSIFTNSLEVISRAIPYENLDVITLSGTLIRKTYSFAGLDAANVLRNYNITKCFMAATGISLQNGVTNSSPMECEVKKMAVQKSNHVYLLADHTKFDNVSLMTYCSVSDVHTVITDAVPPQKFMDYFKEHEIELIVAE
nr:DeoR/GlpR family DNA-binding transcription regulator [Maliibacterium massiliense]